MITLTQGNLLESNAEALVNTVNAVGVMGKGIALQFKKAFPENFKAYEAACKTDKIRPGVMFVTEARTLHGVRYIINFPTKRHWKGKSRMSDIETGLRALAQEVRSRDIRSIAIPPLGCGLGGLSWVDVRAKIEQAFADLPEVDVRLYAPIGAPNPEAMPNRTKKPNLTPGRTAFLGMLDKYSAMLIDPGITIIETQKLCYFLQLAGEPLRLNFCKAQYGPYADNLRHVLNLLEGHFLLGWGDAQNHYLTLLRLLPNAAAEVQVYLRNFPETMNRIDFISGLVEGFDTPYGMELLASVHWVLANELDSKQCTSEDVHTAISNWTSRKSRMFKHRHVEIAMNRLESQAWL